MPGKLIPLDEQITMVTEAIEDAEFRVKHSKSPIRKRRHENMLNFFKSILNSLQKLNTYDNLSDKELQN